MISRLPAKMEPRLTQSSRNYLSTSNCEIWGLPHISWALKSTGVVPIANSPSPRASSSPISSRSMVWAIPRLSPLLSILALAYPLPCVLRTMQQYPYISVVGSLMYLAVTTRPDIAYAAGVLARFNSNPGPAHWQAAKHVLRYLQGTTHHKLVYQPSTSPEPFITYSDADHGGNPDNGKSTGGYVVKIGSGAVSWSSKLQPLVALSTTEAEHISAVEAGKEILWMRQFMGELGYDISGPSLLRMDNQSAIAVSKNPEHHSKMKHLSLRLFWLRDHVQDGLISPTFVGTQEMAADIYTKALDRFKVQKCAEMLGLFG